MKTVFLQRFFSEIWNKNERLTHTRNLYFPQTSCSNRFLSPEAAWGSLKVIHDFQLTNRISDWVYSRFILLYRLARGMHVVSICTAAYWHDIPIHPDRKLWAEEQNGCQQTTNYGWAHIPHRVMFRLKRTCCPWTDQTWNSQWNSIIHNPLLIYNPQQIRQHSIIFPPFSCQCRDWTLQKNNISRSHNKY